MAEPRPLRIAFDVGGVLSKYPHQLGLLIDALGAASPRESRVEVHVISDFPKAKLEAMLLANGFGSIPLFRVHSADYAAHGEACKAVLCEELGIDILIDDFMGYVASQGRPPVRLLVMPDATRSYYAEDWKTDGTEGDFGRKRSETP